MRFHSLFASLLISILTTGSFAADLDARAGRCNADNCARAVTGTARGNPASRLSDCSAFLQVTVLSTVVITSAGGSPVPSGTPSLTSATSPPSYASACSGASRYSSACSCGGVTSGSTVTQTVTIAPTPTATSPGVCPAYQIVEMGMGLCRCQYDVGCGKLTSNGFVDTLNGTFTEDECRDACDAQYGCPGFNYGVQGGAAAGECQLVRGAIDGYVTDPTYDAGRRQDTCCNPKCGYPPDTGC